jgi:hypothetical protein
MPASTPAAGTGRVVVVAADVAAAAVVDGVVEAAVEGGVEVEAVLVELAAAVVGGVVELVVVGSAVVASAVVEAADVVRSALSSPLRHAANEHTSTAIAGTKHRWDRRLATAGDATRRQP